MRQDQDQKKSNQQGLSLIEVLASLVQLSLLAFIILAIFSPAARWIAAARQETTAVYFAAGILENLRSEPGRLDPVHTGQTAQEMGLAVGYPGCGMMDEISRMQAQAAYPNLYDVTVTIAWPRGTETQSISLSTVIRKN
ncbi:MAG: hypothetical protein NTV45_06355 [Firmicutes bacterium]|nr:hypothetical protein [Bacillota bacterium]